MAPPPNPDAAAAAAAATGAAEGAKLGLAIPCLVGEYEGFGEGGRAPFFVGM